MTERVSRILLTLCIALSLGACDEPPEEISSGWDGTGVGWTTELVSRVPEVSREAQLQGLAPIQEVRRAAEDGFDRFVIEIQGRGMPNYEVEYADEPLRDCRTGAEVSVAGEAVIHVRLEPAVAHEPSGQPLFRDAPAETGLPVLLEQRLVCDSDGSVEWALGVARRAQFRVIQLTELNRIVVDVRH
ncbi:MAG: hypothetical protein WD766_08760 [Gemmatimonadota bacterium]